MKNLYVVLGMARSGTSAIARGLGALGIDLGKNLTEGNARWNAKGFYEDNEIVYKVNRTALHLLDSPWGMRPLQKASYGGHVTMQKLHQYALDLLKQRMQYADYWGFKDPRTATLLPFWQPIFNELGVNEHYVIALRNPLSSAYSYQSLSDCDLEEVLIMWLMHMVPAISSTEGKSRVIVHYDALLNDPYHELARIKRDLHLPELTSQAEIDTYAKQFIDRKLHRHEYSHDDLRSHLAVKVAPLVLRVYEILLRVARDEIKFSDAAFTDAWQMIMVEFESMVPLYDYIRALMVKNKNLTRELKTIRKSLVWRLAAPLRFIDDSLRYRRRKRREQKRLRYATE